jgi:hypothetical protein
MSASRNPLNNRPPMTANGIYQMIVRRGLRPHHGRLPVIGGSAM